jgi:hypothetical protein
MTNTKAIDSETPDELTALRALETVAASIETWRLSGGPRG